MCPSKLGTMWLNPIIHQPIPRVLAQQTTKSTHLSPSGRLREDINACPISQWCLMLPLHLDSTQHIKGPNQAMIALWLPNRELQNVLLRKLFCQTLRPLSSPPGFKWLTQCPIVDTRASSMPIWWQSLRSRISSQ